MAFFDSLGKKFAQVGQETMQKTRDMTDVARLNAMISEEEKKIIENYQKIGKQYLALHADDHESAFAEWIAEIRCSEQKIANGRQQIQNLKGITHCDRCGAEIHNQAAFCSVCGNKMNVPADRDVCTSCGALVAKGMRFCTSCGVPMAQANEEAKPVLPDGDSAKNDFKICSACGEKMSVEEMFCTECGTKL